MEEENVEFIDNIEIHKDEKYVVVSVNPKIYNLPIVYAAAYVLIDRAYVILDGDPNEEILVKLRPKEKDYDLEKLGRELNEELLNYSVYMVQSVQNKEIRDAIMKRAMETHKGD